MDHKNSRFSDQGWKGCLYKVAIFLKGLIFHLCRPWIPSYSRCKYNWQSPYYLSEMTLELPITHAIWRSKEIIFGISILRLLCLLTCFFLLSLLVSCKFDAAIKLFLVHLNLGSYWIEPIRNAHFMSITTIIIVKYALYIYTKYMLLTSQNIFRIGPKS